MRRSNGDLVRGWLEKARRDLATAERGLADPEPFRDIICFHAQQAVEKHLKAFLIFHEIDFPKTHVLEDLVLLAESVDAQFEALRETVVILTPYAVETRYPEFEEPTAEDAAVRELQIPNPKSQ